ncbi:IS1 family transposase [Candidatus Enterovibrio escicola]|uniref:IS1 family transposase n=1 Tax=Candidatus Enterovibrio escicola TaxID=1927127 RepID=UPI000BE39016
MAHAFGYHERKIFNLSSNQLSIFNVVFLYTDCFRVYDIFPEDTHIISKLYTQHLFR